MTDLEIVRACAGAMGLKDHPQAHAASWLDREGSILTTHGIYDPLHDDAQVMALEVLILQKHGALHFYHDHLLFYPYKTGRSQSIAYVGSIAEGKRRAICLTVAQLHLASSNARGEG